MVPPTNRPLELNEQRLQRALMKNSMFILIISPQNHLPVTRKLEKISNSHRTRTSSAEVLGCTSQIASSSEPRQWTTVRESPFQSANLTDFLADCRPGVFNELCRLCGRTIVAWLQSEKFDFNRKKALVALSDVFQRANKENKNCFAKKRKFQNRFAPL